MNTKHKAKDRIIKAAFELMHMHGIKGTSLDKILEKSKTGKSQFAHYFKNKEGLIQSVIDYIEEVIRSEKADSNYAIKTWQDFESWFPRFIKFQENVACTLSCPLGTIGNDLSEEQQQLRRSVVAFFEWSSSQLARFFAERKAAGELADSADPDALADFCITVMEGGMLMSKIKRNTLIFENAANQAMNYIKLLRKNTRPRLLS